MSILLPIPPIETATDPIHSPSDLRERWRALMGPLGFGERLLWIGFVGEDRRMIKTLSQLPVGRSPDRALVLDLMLALTEIVGRTDGTTTVAMLLSRPGRDRPGAGDRRWAEVLAETAGRVGVQIEPVFMANDRAVHAL